MEEMVVRGEMRGVVVGRSPYQRTRCVGDRDKKAMSCWRTGRLEKGTML